MKRVLLSGGAGFVGANLARRLHEKGNDVHLILREEGDRWRLAGVDLTVHEADLRDAEAVRRAVDRAAPEWVFHLAAHGAYSHQTDLVAIAAVNITGTINLLQACIDWGVDAFVNTGSSSEYGYKDHAPAENVLLEPNSHYAWTKAAATHYCRFVASTSSIHLPTLRLYSAYGPFEEPGRLLPTLVARGFRGELPPLVDPATGRDFVYIDDVCDAYLLAASCRTDERGPVYNVGSGVQTTLADIVEVARRRFGIEQEPEWGAMKNRRWDTNVWVSDNRKIREQLGWEPAVTLEDGFDRFASWYEGHPELHERYR